MSVRLLTQTIYSKPYTKNIKTYEDGPGVEDHALEGAVLYVLPVVCDVDPPLPRLVWLEGSVEGTVILRHRTPCSKKRVKKNNEKSAKM